MALQFCWVFWLRIIWSNSIIPSSQWVRQRLLNVTGIDLVPSDRGPMAREKLNPQWLIWTIESLPSQNSQAAVASARASVHCLGPAPSSPAVGTPGNQQALVLAK